MTRHGSWAAKRIDHFDRASFLVLDDSGIDEHRDEMSIVLGVCYGLRPA